MLSLGSGGVRGALGAVVRLRRSYGQMTVSFIWTTPRAPPPVAHKVARRVVAELADPFLREPDAHRNRPSGAGVLHLRFVFGPEVMGEVSSAHAYYR